MSEGITFELNKASEPEIADHLNFLHGRSRCGFHESWRRRVAAKKVFRCVRANRFFGRSQDIAAMVTRMREQALVGVVGPSGVGKSSFVRAGVVPTLKNSGDAWEVLIVRPGRHPLAALAGALESLRRFKDEANEVHSGTECGIGVKQYNDVQPGDQIECFERIEVARTL